MCEGKHYCSDALQIFDDALEHFRIDATLHFRRTIEYEDLGRFNDAEESLRRCLEREPS